MSSDKGLIDIVIATCNGEKYIKEQICSIIELELFNVYIRKIIVCDDKSEDNTLAIIRSLVHHDKLMLVTNGENTRLGPTKNFIKGMSFAEAEFIMLSDQDDVWCNQKLKLYIDALNNNNNNEDLLIFSDLNVVNSELKIISPSFYRYQHFNPQSVYNLKSLFLENVVPGCTMMFNRRLLNKAVPLANSCRMHDWWLILCAAVYGKIVYIDESLSQYRQHSNNQVGAQRRGIIDKLFNLSNIFKTAKQNFKKTISQLNDFLIIHDNHIPETERLWAVHLINCYYEKKIVKKIGYLTKLKIKKSTPMKTLLVYLFLITGER
ncbi:glycosyltransferase family 2 protein [Enterobacter cloacae]|uniref:glycosyltransferase family 2 protein n=1 Tax=Enterobacter cloacae TaxID=550 RepID=UPI0020761793|nr:glycosyltransferase family 2 protein [Enterobacter cloacae]MCM7496578.1 glycosyltransferase family 2 protein [Enterobacter cloacae]